MASEVGECNICGDVGPLCEDHVPPQGCVRPTSVAIRRVLARISPDKKSGKGARGWNSHDGVKFKTLCINCNTALLGATLDPALIEFSNAVARVAQSPVHLPPVVSIPSDVGRVARSVVGHIFAHERCAYNQKISPLAWKLWLSDLSLPIPSGHDLHYWLYPYKRQVYFNGASMFDFGAPNEPAPTYRLLKFYPLAFALSTTSSGGRLRERSLSRLDPLVDGQRVDVPVDFRWLRPELFLEFPGDGTLEAVLTTDDNLIANERGHVGKLIRK